MFTRDEYRQWVRYHCTLFPGFDSHLPAETIDAWYDVFVGPQPEVFDADDFIRWSKGVALSGREVRFWELGRKSICDIKAEIRQREMQSRMQAIRAEDPTRYDCPLCMDRAHVCVQDEQGVRYAVQCGASPTCRERAESLERDGRLKDRPIWWSPDQPVLRLKDGRRLTLIKHTVLEGHYPGDAPPRARPGTVVDFSSYEID